MIDKPKFLAMAVCILCFVVFIIPAGAFETSSGNFIIDIIAFPNGGGSTSALNTALSFSLVGDGIASLGQLAGSQFFMSVGQGNLLSALLEQRPARWLIDDLRARTDVLGEEIPPATWQKTTGPYFSWAVIADPLFLKGFTFALDNKPDGSLAAAEPFYQYADKALPSGKHVFYVVPLNQMNLPEYDNMLSFEIWVDVTPPSVGQLTPSSGSILSQNHQAISCSVSDIDSGIDTTATTLTLNAGSLGFTFDETNGTLTSSSAALAEGTNTVLAKVYDKAGNSVVQGWDFVVDSYPPQGTVLINNGAEVTHSGYVTLNLQASDATTGVAAVYISNDGIFDTEYNNPYAYSPVVKNWLLSEPDVDGIKKVYVKFKDGAGNISPTAPAQITLRRMTPNTSIISGPEAVSKETSADFRFEATQAGSLFSYSLDNQKWSDWSTQQEAHFAGLAEGNHYFYVKSAYDLNGDGQLSLDEEDPTPAQWVWSINPEGVLQKLKERILFWKR